jgi:hypothetical protein
MAIQNKLSALLGRRLGTNGARLSQEPSKVISRNSAKVLVIIAYAIFGVYLLIAALWFITGDY